MIPTSINQKHILFGALNWGMGHVARSIGLLRQLQMNNEITIVCDSHQYSVFKSYFPEFNYITKEGYPFNFKGKGNFRTDLIRSLPRLANYVREEVCFVESCIDTLQVDLVISDNRYGFYSKKCPSILLTHQLNLPLHWWEYPAQMFLNKLLMRFNSIWVPDGMDRSLSGKLSQNKQGLPVQYIGFLSRFEGCRLSVNAEQRPILILSGPAVYRQILIEKAVQLSCEFEVVYVSDKHDKGIQRLMNEFPEVSFRSVSSWNELDDLLCSTSLVISWCGYSTLLDLQFLNVDALLFPTPGQSEQAYLYSRWLKNMR